MGAHVSRCKQNPDKLAKKRQKTSPSTQIAEEELSVVSSPHVNFDQVKC
jgi:hypothetical protein